MPRLVTLPEVAARFRVSPRTVRDWVLRKTIPFTKVGGVRFSEDDLVKFELSRRVAPIRQRRAGGKA